MAQEEYFIAVVSERLSRPGDTRYVIIDKQTQQEVDTCNGHGYKSAASAHKSFSFKQRQRQSGVHAYRSTPDGQGRSTNRGQTAYGKTARQVPMNAQPASGNGQPRDLVSPFVQKASAGYQCSTVIRDDGSPQVTRVNSWSGYAPRRASAPRQAQPQSYARPQRRYYEDVTQENTPPPPDLFDFKNK